MSVYVCGSAVTLRPPAEWRSPASNWVSDDESPLKFLGGGWGNKPKHKMTASTSLLKCKYPGQTTVADMSGPFSDDLK